MANELVEKALTDTINDFVNVVRKHISIYRTKILYQEAMIDKRRAAGQPTEEEEQVLQEYKDATAAIMCLEDEVDIIDLGKIIDTIEAKKLFVQHVNESLGH